jgi:hypothetical protein
MYLKMKNFQQQYIRFMFTLCCASLIYSVRNLTIVTFLLEKRNKIIWRKIKLFLFILLRYHIVWCYPDANAVNIPMNNKLSAAKVVKNCLLKKLLHLSNILDLAIPITFRNLKMKKRMAGITINRIYYAWHL